MTDPRFVNPPELGPTPGYTHVVETTGRRLVFVSGQVPLDAGGNLVGEGDMGAQARKVFENLATALAAVGLNFTHVAKLTYFVTDFSRMPEVRAVRDAFVDPARPPASSAVQVVRLFREGLMIEVEAIAVAPD